MESVYAETQHGEARLVLMKVLHVIPSLSPSQGGPSMALPVMASALVAQGVEVDVVTTDDDGAGLRLPKPSLDWQTMPGGWRVRYFPKQTEFYKVSLPLGWWLLQHVADYDGVHVHAVFSFASSVAGIAALRAGVPFWVRPLGTLNAWGMKNRRRWLKRLSFRLLDKPWLDRAAAIHCTSHAEAAELAPLGLRSRAVVVPLGMDLGAFDVLPPASVFQAAFPQAGRGNCFLYLSRLDPKKGLETLLAAFASCQARRQGWQLVIAGSGDPSYELLLKEQADALGLSEKVIWAGFLGGEVRLAALSACRVFVLPSHSENFGIALLEAMAAGLACVATPGVALAVDAAQDGAVLLAQEGETGLAEAMDQLAANPEKCSQLGQCAADLARRHYTAAAMGKALESLYCLSLR
jgi:glycosyltransferase involved in cell wall biosynthesis